MYWQKTLKISPLDLESRFNLALLYWTEFSERSKALQLFHEVVNLSSPDSVLHKNASKHINEMSFASIEN